MYLRYVLAPKRRTERTFVHAERLDAFANDLHFYLQTTGGESWWETGWKIIRRRAHNSGGISQQSWRDSWISAPSSSTFAATTSHVFFCTYRWTTVMPWRTARRRKVCQRGANGPRWPWRWSRPGFVEGVKFVRDRTAGLPRRDMDTHARATERRRRANDRVGKTTTIDRGRASKKKRASATNAVERNHAGSARRVRLAS